MIVKLVYGDILGIDRITGLIFFHDIINSQRYMKQMLHPLFEWLIDEEHWYVFFQQDSTTAHTAGHQWTP
jgi:hypothetical protein